MNNETFITKSPDYTKILDAFEQDPFLKSKCTGGFFWTSPIVPIGSTYLYLEPLANNHEQRAMDTGLIQQNDLISIYAISTNNETSQNLDAIVKNAYQIFYNSGLNLVSGGTIITSITKKMEYPVIVNQALNTKQKELVLAITYLEA